MVKCFVAPTGGTPQVRYVPADIFEMWRFLMERVHQLTVEEPRVSMWVAADGSTAQPEAHPLDSVIEISFRYHDMGSVGRRVVRYFPENDFDAIFAAFRKHFPDDDRMHEISRRAGFFFTGTPSRPLGVE